MMRLGFASLNQEAGVDMQHVFPIVVVDTVGDLCGNLCASLEVVGGKFHLFVSSCSDGWGKL